MIIFVPANIIWMRKKAGALPRKDESASRIVDLVINGIREKKGKNIIRLDLRSINNAVCDYFVICHGDSERQVDAIARSVEEEVKKNSGEKVWRKEGYENAQWILLDYVDVVAHVFLKQTREFYDLEALWADADSECLLEDR